MMDKTLDVIIIHIHCTNMPMNTCWCCSLDHEAFPSSNFPGFFGNCKDEMDTVGSTCLLE